MALETKRKRVLRYDESAEEHSYHLPPGGENKLRIVPPSAVPGSTRERDCYFIAGASGSGKSWTIASLLEVYRWRGRKVFGFSDIKSGFKNVKWLDIEDFVSVGGEYYEQDALYQEQKIRLKHVLPDLSPEQKSEAEVELHRMKPNPTLKRRLELSMVDEEMGKFFRDSVVFFDDYERNENKAHISWLRDHLLTKGRHWHCSVIVANHKPLMGGENLVFQESTNVVLFQKGAKMRRSFMKNYLGWSPDEIGRAEAALRESRWITIDLELGLAITEYQAFRTEG